MPSQTTPLVGRAHVLAELDALLSEACGGRGGVVLLTGEAGIGKTRVAEELVRRSDGIAAHWAWCRTEQAAGSLRTWSKLLRALAQTHANVSELAASRETLRTLVAGSSEGAHPHPDASRAALAADVAEVLRVAGDVPRLLVLDDLHDAEPSSLRLLVDLTADLRTLPVLVVATARDTGWEGREQLRADLLRSARRIALEPLDSAQIAELLGPTDAGRADELARRSGGNPLLVTELARDSTALPASLRALVAARTAACGATTQDVVAAAAVLGPRFRLDVLAGVADVPLDDLAGHLVDDLFSARTPGEGQFSHELLRDAVYASLDPSGRQHWHGRAGAVLDQLRERGRMVASAEVARHLLLAGPDVRRQAVERCLDAATTAEQLQAFEDAAHWYQEVLDLLEDPAEQAEVLVRRARARRGYGDRDGARTDLLDAGSLAQQANRPDLLAHAALALGTGPGGFEVDLEDGDQLNLLERALASLPADDLALRAAVLARLSVARSLMQTPAERQSTAEEAVILGRAAEDPIALGAALAALCDAVAGPDDVDRRLALASETVDLALQSHDRDLELLGRRLRLVALLEQGDRTGAEREAQAYRLRADEVRHPLYQWYPALWRGAWALAEGRIDDAWEANAEVARIGAGSSNAELLGKTQSWLIHEQLGDVVGVQALMAELDLEDYPGVWPAVALALVETVRGDLPAAQARLEGVGDLVARLAKDSEWLAAMAQAVLTVTHLGSHPLRPALYDALLPYADLHVVEGIGAGLRGPVHRFLALVAPDASARQRHTTLAEAELRRIGATGLLAPVVAGTASLVRSGDVWTLRFGGRVVTVKDGKGMRDLAALLARPSKEIPALDLYGGPIEHDTGELVDASARSSYKRRLGELEERDSLSEAEATERALLLEQLSAAYGLGGPRRTGSSSERARSAVTARVRDLLKRISGLDADIGRHLTHAVRTGTFCSYAPETPTHWDLTL